MFLGIETVSGRCVECSDMVIFTSSSSASSVDVVGEGAVDEGVCIANDWPAVFRECITPLHNCLYTRRASLLLSWSRPVQQQRSERNGCASFANRSGTRFIQEPCGEVRGRAGFTTWTRTAWTGGSSRREARASVDCGHPRVVRGPVGVC
jgi:hypothetical protein